MEQRGLENMLSRSGQAKKHQKAAVGTADSSSLIFDDTSEDSAAINDVLSAGAHFAFHRLDYLGYFQHTGHDPGRLRGQAVSLVHINKKARASVHGQKLLLFLIKDYRVSNTHISPSLYFLSVG